VKSRAQTKEVPFVGGGSLVYENLATSGGAYYKYDRTGEVIQQGEREKDMVWMMALLIVAGHSSFAESFAIAQLHGFFPGVRDPLDDYDTSWTAFKEYCQNNLAFGMVKYLPSNYNWDNPNLNQDYYNNVDQSVFTPDKSVLSVPAAPSTDPVAQDPLVGLTDPSLGLDPTLGDPSQALTGFDPSQLGDPLAFGGDQSQVPV